MLNSPQYQDIDVVYAGARTVVYRATRRSDRQPVIVKVLQSSHPTFNELVQFRNQYVITQHCDSPFIVKPLALEQYGNGYGLVMPDWGAISLATYWQETNFNLGELLAIAIQLSEALHFLARHQILHKDIKPANILIHPNTKQIQLIDFSIASLLPKEHQRFVHPAGLEGTLAYISPEQTGRMNRGLDYRTDFYGLGVTLYELLTGRLPFAASDPLELLHCHIARSPTAPANLLDHQGQAYPAMLSAIIMKLMAKNAEDRYQSALGLKHDLERCLQSWEGTGEIAKFNLGERDVGDRFLIPEKLYGREKEVQALLNAFERVSRGNSELILVAGFSGIGKTAIVNEVHKPIIAKHGFFIKGKFDQFNRNIPFSAFVQALKNLAEQLLSESDVKIQYWKTRILEAVGDKAQVIIDLIPELEQILGGQPAVSELSGVAAQNRFTLVFQNFIQVFTTSEHPLVIFIDDLQWADAESLKLLQALLTDSRLKHLLLLGAYRDNEVSSAHPLMLTLGELEGSEIQTGVIVLSSLNKSSLNTLISDTFHSSLKATEPVTDLVIQKTQGNPFFVTQFLRALYQDDLIAFDLDHGCWQCDLVQVQKAALTNDVVEFMAFRLKRLPKTTREILTLASCIGAQFDLESLAIIAEQSEAEVAAALWQALQEGMVLPHSDLYKLYLEDGKSRENQFKESLNYQFLHDRVQQAAYSLLAPEQIPEIRLNIGRSLYNHEGTSLFTIADNYNRGLALIESVDEKIKLLDLNLDSANRARLSTAYDVAANYLSVARGIVEDINKSAAEVYFETYLASVEVDIARSRFEQALGLLEIAEQRDYSESIELQIVGLRIKIYTAQLRFSDSIEVGLSMLREKGVELYSVSDINVFCDAVLTTKLPKLDPSQHFKVEAIARILWSLLGAAIFTDPTLYIQLVLTYIGFILEWGNVPSGSPSYFNYSYCLSMMGNYDAAYRIGKRGLKLLEEFPSGKCSSHNKMIYGSVLSVLKEPVAQGCSVLEEGFREGLEAGELEYMGYCANLYCYLDFLSGRCLADVIKKQFVFIQELSAKRLQTSWAYAQFWYQSARVLAEKSYADLQFDFDGFDELSVLRELLDANSGTTLYTYYLSKGVLDCVLGRWSQAESQFQHACSYSGSAGGYKRYVLPFYQSLSLLLTIPDAPDQNTVLERVVNNQNQLKQLAQLCRENYQHKYDLVEAEILRIKDDSIARAEAIEKYDQAIAGARVNGFTQEEALANELAAQFYLAWNKEKVAAGYMQEAYYCYSHWGARAKVTDLEAKYPELLAPILQQQTTAIANLDTLTHALTVTVQNTTHSLGHSISDTLDFASVLQAAQKLSSTIELDQLLREMTEIILTNTGAQNIVLLTPMAGEWQLQATAKLVEGEIKTDRTVQPLTPESPVPIRLIQYVKNTQTSVLVSEATTELTGILEGYLLKYQPQSVFCAPLLNQGNLVAIAYLEHPTTKGVFTPSCQTIVEFLCTQAAIALKNAQLYQQAQTTLNDLKKTQLQLVQSEKMSALGNLMARVAHEINNPVSFLKGNIQPAQDYIRDLFQLIDLYQEKLPEPDRDIEDEIEAMDLEFVRDDLPRLIGSMNVGVNRIRNISDSLRSFSRTDHESQTAFNIHEGIDGTLLILKHRTKGNEERPAIEIVKDYGELPKVQCFPGQLNQVFMNILANAIDAFDGGNWGRSYQDIEGNPNTITITTTAIDTQVEIKIQDNGCGMSPETTARIFEQGFTTKEVGKGTGLGMAIAHQIVTEPHGGRIVCESKLGEGTTFTIVLPLDI